MLIESTFQKKITRLTRFAPSPINGGDVNVTDLSVDVPTNSGDFNIIDLLLTILMVILQTCQWISRLMMMM